jgi:cytochrome c-type biogenesis protein
MFTQSISYSAAFLAGLLSFLSPCVLPLIPAYFTFITGFSMEELFRKDSPNIRKKVFFSTLAFVAGFTVVFVAMGAAASGLGGLIAQYKDYIRIIGGLIIILLGIHMTGWVRIKKLDIEKRIHIQKKPIHLLGTFIVGMAFGVGWSPCIGPLLGSILIIAGSKETIWQGVTLLSIYAAGLALPFIIMSIFINFLLEFLRSASRVMKYINPIAGILFIVVGLFLITDSFTFFNTLLTFSHE